MDSIFQLLHRPVYGSVDVLRLVGLMIAFVVLRWLWRLVRPKRSIVEKVTRPVVCACGWRGRASIHAPRCPRCGQTVFSE